MLVSMTVRNIALIEQLQLEFQKGMQVLSGETGAGKSIIVDSINLVLGERADRGLIRSGCDRASVEALVDISDCPQAAAVLAEQQLEAEGGLISIQREISTGERNLCRVCGVIVPLAFLRRLTALLVDVHGQHAHQSLLDAKNHMAFLDSFGDAAFEAQKRRVEERYHLWRESSGRFAMLRKENEQRAQQQEYKALADRLASTFYEAEELGIELRDVLESENFDPERNEAVQERLDLIRRLERRYGMPAEELAAHHEEMKDELASLENMDERRRRAEAD